MITIHAKCQTFIQNFEAVHTQEFCSRECSTNAVEDRGQVGRGYGGSSLLSRGFGSGCNLVQII